MARKISQRELRNNSGDVMRALDRGEALVVTGNGVPVGELTPLRSRTFVPAPASHRADSSRPRGHGDGHERPPAPRASAASRVPAVRVPAGQPLLPQTDRYRLHPFAEPTDHES